MTKKKIFVYMHYSSFIYIILLIGYGGILKYSLTGGKFTVLRNIALSFAEIP